ncbi:MAG: hypothetical protein HYR85_21545 [Planctomycetes bacterium]|nr:hypothetical protein [Planctomycetota bacterium]MBI3845870.1 hypothetical protein [Planctomycetota bacterium]
MEDRRGMPLAVPGAHGLDSPLPVESLYDVLTHAASLEDVADLALARVVNEFGVARAELWLVVPGTQTRCLVGAAGTIEDGLPRGAVVPNSDDLIGQAISSGRPMERASAGTRSQPIRALPLRSGADVVGAIVLAPPAGQAISAARGEAIAAAMGRLAAVARAHDERVRDRLFRYERLSLVGQLAASAAHEVNNILLSVSLRARRIAERTPNEVPEDVREAARVIEEETAKIGRILHGLLQPARAKREPRAAVSLSDVLHRTLDLVSPLFSKSRRIRTESHCEPDLPLVIAEASELEQVFTNLMLNAAQAMPSGGGIRIFTRLEGSWVVAGVADTGPGIPKETLDHVFEPFFTTRAAQGGTGLGLTVVKEIVKSHGGEIEVESTEGVGTEFRIRLPRAPQPEARQDPADRGR